MQPILAANDRLELYTPASIVTWYAESPPPSGDASADNVVGLIGTAVGGVQNRVYDITDSVMARAIFRSGELLDSVIRGLNPGATGGRLPRIKAVNVAGGTTASFNVKDSAAATILTLKLNQTAREGANRAQFALAGSRTSPTGFTVRVIDPESGADVAANYVGLGLYLQYNGSGSASTASVTTVAGTRYLGTTITGAAQDNLLIPLPVGFTINELVREINAQGNYTAFVARSRDLEASGLDVTTVPVNIQQYAPLGTSTTVVAQGATSITLAAGGLTRAAIQGETLRFRGPGGNFVPFQVGVGGAALGATVLPTTALSDTVPAGSTIFDNASLAPGVLTAVKADLLLYFSTFGSAVVDVTSGPSSLDPAPQQGNFTGGGTLPTNLIDWDKAVENLLQYSLAVICPITDDPGIAAAVRASVSSSQRPEEGKWVMTVTGISSSLLPASENRAAVDAYVTQVQNELLGVGSYQDQVVCTAADTLNPASGRLVRTAPYLIAPMIAALRAAIGAEEGLTRKTLQASNSYPKLNLTQAGKLVKAGAVLLETPQVGASVRLVRDRTTYNGVDSPIYESGKAVFLVNSIARQIRAIQDVMIPGHNATQVQLADFKETMDRFFTNLETAGRITKGVNPDGTEIPAWTFEVGRTQNSGQKVVSRSRINPVLEFIVGDHTLVARPVEIEI